MMPASAKEQKLTEMSKDLQEICNTLDGFLNRPTDLLKMKEVHKLAEHLIKATLEVTRAVEVVERAYANAVGKCWE